jgi:hypothetical protein
MVLLHAPVVTAFGLQPQEQAMRNPQPFVVIQNAKPLFTVYAYSLEQARVLVVARLADTTGILIVAQRKGSLQ